jgi:hypothetical protein
VIERTGENKKSGSPLPAQGMANGNRLAAVIWWGKSGRRHDGEDCEARTDPGFGRPT